MELSVDQKLAINMKVARDMWPGVISTPQPDGSVLLWNDDGFPPTPHDPQKLNIFDPEKSDINKAVEFYELDVVQNSDETWSCGNFDIAVRNESRDSAMQQAVTAASGGGWNCELEKIS